MEELFLKSPWMRTFIPLVLLGIAGIAGNSLVVEIATGNEINWSQIPNKVSFYIFLIATMVLCFYQIQISKYDRNMIKGFTPKQYEAAIRNKVAEDIAKRSKKLIRNGNIEQLEKETETFKKLYGELEQ